MKVLIIGLGSIALKHVNALLKIDESIELFALRSSKNNKNIASVNNIYSFKEIHNIAPDFIIISNPTSKHYETLEKLAERSIPLFIEKPVLNSLTNSRKLMQALKRTKTYVACNLRFLDSLTFIDSYLKDKDKKINEVNIYAGSYLPDWRPNQNFRKTYSAIAQLGGGVHLDLIHELDYTYWLFGKPRNINSFFSSKSSLDIEAIDSANYFLEYDDFNVNITLNYYRKDYKRTLEILFEEETIIVDLHKNKVVNHEDEVLFEGKVGLRDTYLPQLRYFIDFIKSDSNHSRNSFEEGIEVLKICLNE